MYSVLLLWLTLTMEGNTKRYCSAVVWVRSDVRECISCGTNTGCGPEPRLYRDWLETFASAYSLLEGGVGETTLMENQNVSFHDLTRGENKRNDVKAISNLEQDSVRRFTKGSVGSNLTFEEKERHDGFELTEPEQNPYAVLLVMKRSGGNKAGLCSGSLLTAEWVLTAAHCVKGDDFTITEIQVIAGATYEQDPSSKVQQRESREFFAHPSYPRDPGCDAGVAKVDGKFQITAYVQPVQLSTEPWTYYSYQACRITGFGRVFFREKVDADDMKRKTHYLLVKNPCLCNYKLKMLYGRLTAKKSICTKSRNDYGICSGDSGGGLICNGSLVATAMALMKIYDLAYCEIDSTTSFSCGTDQSLSMFLSVCPHLKFINSHVGLMNDSDISEKCLKFSSASIIRASAADVLIISLAFLSWRQH